MPRRKDGRDLWTVNDNPLSEEPGAKELLKSQILVTGWLDAGAAGADSEAADGEANRTSEEEEQSKLEVNATSEPEPPSKLVLHIDTDAQKSLSAPAPVAAPVANHVGPAAPDDDKEGKVLALDPSLSSTPGSPSITITQPSGEAKSLSEKDTNPPHVGTLLPTIKEPEATAEDATAEEEDKDKVGEDLPSLSPLPETKRRRSILGMGLIRLGSRRFRPLARANTSASASVTTTTTTTNAPERRRSLAMFIRRQAPSPSPTPTPTKDTFARVEEKMVDPMIHTPASLTTHIMQIEDEEERQRAEMFFG